MTTTATMSAPLIAELTQEAATTRRVLERVPEDKLAWTPHPKSMTLGTLALHVAMIPGALADLIAEPAQDIPNFTPPEATSVAQLLGALDTSIATGSARLAAWSDEYFATDWTVMREGATLLALPRINAVRSIMFNHWYHHRGQLVVYLRLLDVPVPSVYGPSADENPFG